MNKITSDCSEGLMQKLNMGGEGYAVDRVWIGRPPWHPIHSVTFNIHNLHLFNKRLLISLSSRIVVDTGNTEVSSEERIYIKKIHEFMDLHSRRRQTNQKFSKME